MPIRDHVFDNIVNFPKIAYPAFIFLGVTFYAYSARKRMPVNIFKHIIGVIMLKVMSRFKLKVFFDFN